MNRPAQLRTLAFAGVALIALASGLAIIGRARAGSPPAQDESVAGLLSLSQQARDRVRSTRNDPVLRQVDVHPYTGEAAFRFTDAEARYEITVHVPRAGAPPSDWQVYPPNVSPLTGYRADALDLGALVVGPGAVAQAMIEQWPGCTPGFVTLFGQRADLEWTGFCTLPDGRVATGTMNATSGIFVPSAAPPAAPPSTTLPSPRATCQGIATGWAERALALDRPAGSHDVIEIVPAHPDDAPTLRRITLLSKATWGYAPEWLSAWAAIFRLSPEYVSSHVAFKLVEDDDIVGWYALQPGDRVWILDHLWLAPNRIGQGLGRRLFQHAVEQARAGGAQRLE